MQHLKHPSCSCSKSFSLSVSLIRCSSVVMVPPSCVCPRQLVLLYGWYWLIVFCCAFVHWNSFNVLFTHLQSNQHLLSILIIFIIHFHKLVICERSVSLEAIVQSSSSSTTAILPVVPAAGHHSCVRWCSIAKHFVTIPDLPSPQTTEAIWVWNSSIWFKPPVPSCLATSASKIPSWIWYRIVLQAVCVHLMSNYRWSCFYLVSCIVDYVDKVPLGSGTKEEVIIIVSSAVQTIVKISETIDWYSGWDQVEIISGAVGVLSKSSGRILEEMAMGERTGG